MKKLMTVTMMAVQAAIFALPMTAHADVAHVDPTVQPAPQVAPHLTVAPEVRLTFSGAQTQAGSLRPPAIQPVIRLPLPR